MGVDHLDLVVSSMETSLPFYRELLAPLGYVREGSIRGERGEVVVYLNRVEGLGSVGLRERPPDAPGGPFDRYAVGLHHLCFAAPSRRAVDQRAAWLREQGTEIESGPEECGYTPAYYAVFFFDPDAIKLEIVHRPEEEDLVRRIDALARRVAELEGG